MRTITMLAAGVAIAFAGAASAQDAATPSAPAQQPPAQAAPETGQAAPQTGQTAPGITSINIVDIAELPAETQTQVNQVAESRSETDLEQLRSSIDATPELASALQEKGLSSADVIVASLSQSGSLTLVTKKQPG